MSREDTAQGGGRGKCGGFLAWGAMNFQSGHLGGRNGNRPRLSLGGSGSSGVASQQHRLGLDLPYRTVRRRHPPLPLSSNEKDGHEKGGGRSWQPSSSLAASTSSFSGDGEDDNECKGNHNLHWLPPHQGLAPHLNA